MDLRLEDFQYELPNEKIAKHPLSQRDQAKLLVYANGKIQDNIFNEITEILPENANLFFNNTKVIPARLQFRKEPNQHEQGALIEIFLLNPEIPSHIISQTMRATAHCVWKCMIGNMKKWKEGTTLRQNISIKGQALVLTAKLINRDEKLVAFEWDGDECHFVEVVEAAGKVPLPPYLRREATSEDKNRYQTVYSQLEGAVAAPTAGLHFTDEILENVRQNGMTTNFLTLHVSAGTFQPIKTRNPEEHPMHNEQIVITKSNLLSLLQPEKKVIAVGTTSMRTLESLYWYGVKLLKKGDPRFLIEKLMPYGYHDNLPDRQEAFEAILQYMHQRNIEQLIGETEIFIFPGYQFRVCQGLVTNFHLPGSTLILLVAAFIGPDWQQIYKYALDNNYRFLSYGDTSLLLP